MINNYDEYMDKECIELCDILNTLPGLKTFESCCGHLKDRYSIWFICDNIDTLSRLGRAVCKNYSDGKWEIVVDSTDMRPRGVFWLRTLAPFVSQDEMGQSLTDLISNIKHWFKAEFDEYFAALAPMISKKSLDEGIHNLDEATNRQAALEQPYKWEEEQDGSFGVTPLFVMSNIRSAFKAGAEWMAEQGETQIVKTKAVFDSHGVDYGGRYLSVDLPDDTPIGTEFIIQIRKK